MRANSMLDLSLSDFLVFSVAVIYSISCFHNFQCSKLKYCSCGGLNLSIIRLISGTKTNLLLLTPCQELLRNIKEAVQAERDCGMILMQHDTIIILDNLYR